MTESTRAGLSLESQVSSHFLSKRSHAEKEKIGFHLPERWFWSLVLPWNSFILGLPPQKYEYYSKKPPKEILLHVMRVPCDFDMAGSMQS